MARKLPIVVSILLVLPMLFGLLSSIIVSEGLALDHRLIRAVTQQPSWSAGVSPVPPATNPGGGPPDSPISSSPTPPFVVAAIWVGIIGSIGGVVALFARIYLRHNEHPAYDDHLTPDIWARGLEGYLRLIGEEKSEEDGGAKNP